MSVADAKHRSVIEWQTKVLASFLSGLAQSKDGAKEMARAVEKLTIFPGGSSAKSPPTVDHLAPEVGVERKSSSSVTAGEPKAGSHEKLMSMFGGARRL